MAVIQRFLGLAFLPIVILITWQTLYPKSIRAVQDVVQPYLERTPLLSALFFEKLPSRYDTPLVVTAFPHWSHYEKIAKIAVVLADLGYPITFITGRIFENEVKALHTNITFWPIYGKPDKMTPEDYKMLESFVPGSAEQNLFMQKKTLIDGIPDQQLTLEQVFKDFRERHGDDKPLISMFDLPFVGHHPILLGAPGIKPDASIAIGCHPLMLNSNDTFPLYMSKRPHVGPDAKAVHYKANQAEHMDFATRHLSEAYWQKIKEVGATEVRGWHIYHALNALPEHLMALGVPEFEFPRNDLRANVNYFGGLKTKPAPGDRESELPYWWDDVAAAKVAGKSIVAVSQGTVGLNLNDLLIPTLDALKHRDDILVIATTVAVEVADVPGLVIPSNARVAKFVPYDLLLPQIDVLVNNGGYGAVISSLQAGIPMVLAGEGQDKNLTNAIVAWKEVGVNLGRMNPSVGEVHDAVTEVLKDAKYKRNAAAMSREFGKYDMGTVFDSVIQNVIRKWQEKKR